jgi:SAM-dependent methyltransferase
VSSVAQHYRELLADVYSWMLGGFDAGIERNVEFFERHEIRPRAYGRAVDLGAGCGFQAIPLARAGFEVCAIDLDPGLLDELERHDPEGSVRTIVGDLMDFGDHADGPLELAVCMTDTLLHLESTNQVRTLFERLHRRLEPGGRFIATFRDLSSPLEGLDRFIPVKSSDSRLLTCFLEDADGRIKVHDLLHERVGEAWHFSKSFYYKLKISAHDARSWLHGAGFDDVQTTVDKGLVTLIAKR